MNPLTARLDSHALALDLLAQRQKVLAGNIANADTPGFKARDIDFAQTLGQARDDLAATGRARIEAPVLWRHADQPSLDGNTVDMDRERAAFADNALRYEATLRFINHDVRSLLSAITGQ